MGIRHLALAVLLASSNPDTQVISETVTVYLHNGDRITGEWFFGRPGEAFYLKTAWGDLQINKFAIARIKRPSHPVLPAP